MGLAAVLVFGGLYASNMGFKINRDLTAPPGKAGTGSTIIALPYYQIDIYIKYSSAKVHRNTKIRLYSVQASLRLMWVIS